MTNKNRSFTRIGARPNVALGRSVHSEYACLESRLALAGDLSFGQFAYGNLNATYSTNDSINQNVNPVCPYQASSDSHESAAIQDWLPSSGQFDDVLTGDPTDSGMNDGSPAGENGRPPDETQPSADANCESAGPTGSSSPGCNCQPNANAVVEANNGSQFGNASQINPMQFGLQVASVVYRSISQVSPFGSARQPNDLAKAAVEYLSAAAMNQTAPASAVVSNLKTFEFSDHGQNAIKTTSLSPVSLSNVHSTQLSNLEPISLNSRNNADPIAPRTKLDTKVRGHEYFTTSVCETSERKVQHVEKANVRTGLIDHYQEFALMQFAAPDGETSEMSENSSGDAFVGQMNFDVAENRTRLGGAKIPSIVFDDWLANWNFSTATADMSQLSFTHCQLRDEIGSRSPNLVLTKGAVDASAIGLPCEKWQLTSRSNRSAWVTVISSAVFCAVLGHNCISSRKPTERTTRYNVTAQKRPEKLLRLHDVGERLKLGRLAKIWRRLFETS